MERVYKAGPRCQQLGQTFGLGFKPDPRDLCQIFTRSEIPSEDCLFNYQRRDNSGSARMGGPDDLLTPLARHKRDRNEWRTQYRPPNRASVAYEANLWPIGLDAADYKANIFFRYFAAVACFPSVATRSQEQYNRRYRPWLSTFFDIYMFDLSVLRSIDRPIFQSIIEYRFARVRWKRNIRVVGKGWT